MKYFINKISYFLLSIPVIIYLIIFSHGPILSFDYYLTARAAQNIIDHSQLAAFGKIESWFPPAIYYLIAIAIKLSSALGVCHQKFVAYQVLMGIVYCKRKKLTQIFKWFVSSDKQDRLHKAIDQVSCQ